jgi:hypothetical protein
VIRRCLLAKSSVHTMFESCTESIDEPTMRPLHESSTHQLKYCPFLVGCSVKSVAHSSLRSTFTNFQFPEQSEGTATLILLALDFETLGRAAVQALCSNRYQALAREDNMIFGQLRVHPTRPVRTSVLCVHLANQCGDHSRRIIVRASGRVRYL